MGPLHFLTIPFAPYCLSYCWKIQVIHHAWRSTWSQFPWYHDHYVTGIQLVVAFRLKEAKVITLLGPLASQVLMSSIFLMLCFLAPFQQPPECGKGLGVNKGSGRSPASVASKLSGVQSTSRSRARDSMNQVCSHSSVPLTDISNGGKSTSSAAASQDKELLVRSCTWKVHALQKKPGGCGSWKVRKCGQPVREEGGRSFSVVADGSIIPNS